MENFPEKDEQGICKKCPVKIMLNVGEALAKRHIKDQTTLLKQLGGVQITRESLELAVLESDCEGRATNQSGVYVCPVVDTIMGGRSSGLGVWNQNTYAVNLSEVATPKGPANHPGQYL